jgi:hypothetical protein
MFARRVGAGILTEGIETVDELRTLVNLGVTYGQGYLLGRPAEPWKPVSQEITRALATGALRTHVARGPGAPAAPPAAAPARVPAAPAMSGMGPKQAAQQAGGASVRWRAPGGSSTPQRPAGPINRRLNRY